jgi:hypothetical protein
MILVRFPHVILRIKISLTTFLRLFIAFTGFETNNKYKVKNNIGQQVYFAAEGI